MKPIFVTIPHAGEMYPPEVKWLAELPETLLMYDVDRYVDQLYAPSLSKLGIPVITTSWHRYVVDPNRIPEDVDSASVEGSPNPVGTHPRGFHWSSTTEGEKLMPNPISQELHNLLVQKIYLPFHEKIRQQFELLHQNGFKSIYHLDCHSCPSVGTLAHKDPGQSRADIIISDVKGKSCSTWFKDLVISSYEEAGFRVAYNWPYFGGRITEVYGQPSQNHHTIQVEMSRALYMDEKTKQPFHPKWAKLQGQLDRAITRIYQSIL